MYRLEGARFAREALAQLDDGGVVAELAKMKAQLAEPKTPPQLPETGEPPAGS